MTSIAPIPPRIDVNAVLDTVTRAGQDLERASVALMGPWPMQGGTDAPGVVRPAVLDPARSAALFGRRAADALDSALAGAAMIDQGAAHAIRMASGEARSGLQALSRFTGRPVALEGAPTGMHEPVRDDSRAIAAFDAGRMWTDIAGSILHMHLDRTGPGPIEPAPGPAPIDPPVTVPVPVDPTDPIDLPVVIQPVPGPAGTTAG